MFKNYTLIFISFLFINTVYSQAFEWDWILVKESIELGGAPTGIVYLYIYNNSGMRFDYLISEDRDGNLKQIENFDYENWKVPANSLSAVRTYRMEAGWIYYVLLRNNTLKVYKREYWEVMPEMTDDESKWGQIEFNEEVLLMKNINIK
ncbi:MAG: hypothetical protein IT280_04755 [Ignavibacteria bacterium]|nr:hypothetical protein [Ignavibacteria bacterium]